MVVLPERVMMLTQLGGLRRSNHWVRLEINIPEDWHKKEWVELEFDPSCEVSSFAVVWSAAAVA